MRHLKDVKPLSVEGLARSFDGVRAVDGLALEVRRGSIVGLVGPNGCGKTTTLELVLGLLEPDAGRVLVAGFDAGTAPARASATYVPDEPAGFDELTLLEFLDLYAALYRADAGFTARAAVYLAAFELAARDASPLGSLSHGLRRAASMVGAFALGATLVVVDEATAALDPEAVVVLREALRAVARRGAGVLVATQDLAFAETVCDHVYLLSGGRLVAEGPLPALLERFRAASLEAAFLAALGRSTRLDALRTSLDAL